MLRRLSVFAGLLDVGSGGWSGGAQTFFPILPHRSTHVLIDKSLVIVEQTDEEIRYRLLETVRQYAREKLIQADEFDTYNRRHRDWFLQWAEEIDPKVRTRDQLVWCDRLERELENFRAALTWSLEQSDSAGLSQRCDSPGALWWFWMIRGYWNEARLWLERALDKPITTPARALPLIGIGRHGVLCRQRKKYRRIV